MARNTHGADDQRQDNKNQLLERLQYLQKLSVI
jgi:hypothetical protein